jgi:hypothetical protein
LSVFRSPETRTISSIADHSYHDKGGFIHIFSAVDKFTKWIEVKPAASITATKAVEFIKEIMYKFGVPNNMITNNGTQFTVREFRDFCVDSRIKINYAQCHTSRAVAKWSAQMAWSFRD